MASLVDFARALSARAVGEIDPHAAHEARRCLLNVLGTSIGASRTGEVDRLVAAVATSDGAVSPPGRAESLDHYSAALATGFAAHLDDFDDTHLATVIHPGAATLGALYPIGLAGGLSGPAALSAFCLGVEAQLRVGLAMSPSHYDRGWHITGTCGVIGAAVAAALALGADAADVAGAIGIASQLTVGHREAFGTPAKALHAGKAAANGLFAATLAMGGGPVGADPFAAGGLFEVLAAACDDRYLDPRDIAGRWVLRDTTYKPFPCGIVAHPAIEAAIGLHSRLGTPAPASIAAVRVRCHPLVVELMGRPSAASGLEARFCAAHGVAVGLLDGAAGLEAFSDSRATAPDVAEVRARTRLQPDDRCARDSATVRVELADGSALEEVVAVAAGSVGRPLSDGALFEKVRALIEPVLPGRAEQIIEVAMHLGLGTSLADLRALVRPVAAASGTRR